MTNLTRDLRRRGPLLWALEPRIMFDGAVAATTATAAAVADATHDASHPAPTPAVIAPVAAPAARQVVFIENDVANYQKLIAQLPAGDEVVVLDSQRDGLAQIAQWAGTHQGYGAMHIISHGEANDLMLGAVQLSNANLASRQADLTTIGQALQPGGDILLYGCDIAAGSDGAAFIQSLAQDTHADVAASTDATGAAALGGNWTLERSTGHIDVASLDLSYDGLLSRPITGTTTFDVADGNVYNPSGSTDSAQNVEGWDFLMQLGQTNNGNQSIIIERPSTVETVDAYSDGTIPITYFSVKPNDGSLFTLNAISVVLNGYDAGTTGGYVQLVGYLNGSAVSGAVLSQNVGDVLQGGGTAVTFNVSGNSAFQGIDSFRLVAASGHSLLGMVGIGAINAINFHFPGPTLTTSGGSSAYSGGSGAAVRVDSGIALSDTASGMQSTATVSITGNFHSGEDWLAFSNNGSTMGNIAGSYNSGTGILTLTSSSASATTAQWQAALEAITYQDTSLTPNTSTRTISFAITDAASNTSSTVTKSVTVAADVAPVIANLNGDTPTYTAGGGAVHLDSGTAATVTDSDSPNFNSGNLTVHISANGQASEDVLGFATSGGSTVSLSNGTNVGSTVTVGSTAIGVIASNGNGVNGHDLIVTLNGSATPTLVTTLVDALTYNDSAGSPNLATRTVQVTVNDGHGQTSSIASIALSMVDLPTLTTSGGSSAFSAGNGSAVTVDSGITLADVGRTSQSSATVSISSNFHSGEDVLAFTNNGSTMGNIAGSYNSGTGILTLTSSSASATNAQWQAALAAVTYLDTSLAPNTSTRTIGFTINNGSYSSSTVTKSVTVAADAAPVISNLNGDSTTFTAGVGAVHLDSGSAATVTDSDSPNFNSGNVTAHISANGQTSEDVLGIDTSGTVSLSNGTSVGSTVSVGGTAIGVIASNGDGVNGHDLVVTLNGNATSARVTTLVDALTYNDSAGSPNTATRTVQVTVNDGHGQTSSAASVGVTVVKGPALTLSSGSAAFVAADNATSTPIVLDGGLTVVDAGSATLASATVSISGNFHSGEDVLAFSNNGSTMGNIVGSYNSGTGVLSLISSSASATLLQWQAALRAITYTDTAVTPNTATRTISVAATDGLGNTGGVMTRTVTVTDTDQTPIISASGGSAAFVAGDNAASTPVVVDNGITVSDLDNTTLASAAVSITGNFHSGEDVLAFSNNGSTMGNIVGSYNSGTGVLTLTSSSASATLTQWQAALRSITYSDTAVTPNSATRNISFTVNDGTKTSSAATRTVTVADTDQTPIVSASGGSAAFVAGDNATSTPVAVDGGITVSDLDNTTLASATVSISGNFHSGEDRLAFTNNGGTMGNIAGSYNSGTGVLTLTSSSASATVAQWQAALRSITYSDTAVTPNNATRSISFAVSDGTKTSTAATRTVTVADTDQTPVVTGSGGSATFSSGAVAVDGGITISDRDNTTLASATVSITANFHSGEDVLAFVNDGSATGNIAGSYSAGTGVLTLTSSGATATVAQWQAALRAVTYRDSAGSPDLSTRAIGFAVSDGVKTSSVATRSVTVLPPMPVVTGLTAASDTGVSHSDGITANATPTVTGTALANATVTVFVDGGSVGTTTADSSGAWQFTLTSALADGRHTVTAQASIGGHQSALSAGDVLTVDTTPPQALSVTPQSASVTSGNSMTFDVVFSEPVTGLAAGSINVIASGQAGGTVTLVTALDATHYRVQVSASGDTGTLAITVPAGATADLAGNLLAAPAVSSAVAVQPAPSVVVSSAVPSRTAPPVSSTPLSLGQSVPTVVLDAARPVAAPASPLSPAGMGAADIASGRAPAGPVVFGRDHFTFVPVVAAAGAAGPDLTPQALPDLGVTALVAGQPFSFSLPSALAAMREADATLNVRVTQHNGQPLPAWLHFDPQRGRFTGTPPAGWHKTLTLEVTVRDHGGHRGVTRLQLRADAQRGETAAQGVPAAGKQALNEQFRQHGKEGAVARLAHWLAG